MITRHLQDAFHQGKRTIGHIWHHATKIAGGLDRTMGMAKRVYGALHPLLDDFGARNTSKALMQGFTAYDQGRDQVMGQHNRVAEHLHRLRRAVPEITMD